MTNWLPDITSGTGPLYQRLAGAIEDAIESGDLPPGSKLPPLRNLAFDIGVTVGTVSRAYALARERSLVSGEVGRGTYVLGNGSQTHDHDHLFAPAVQQQTRNESVSDSFVRMNTTAAPDVGQQPLIQRLIGQIAADHPMEVTNYLHQIPGNWREAGARWLATGSWTPDPANVVPVWGAHCGLMAAIAAATVPGDRIAMDELSYAALGRSASLMGRRIVTMRVGKYGTIPEEFESVCAQQHPKIAFIMHTYHNPLTVSMPSDARQKIADTARRYNVWLLEDLVYETLNPSSLPRLAELAPERTFVVSSIAKSVIAGARGGWVACPAHMAGKVRAAHRLISAEPFLTGELSARLVLEGHADNVREKSRQEILHRVNMAREALTGFDFVAQDHCPFIWLKLPDPWQSIAFRLAAENERILVDDEAEHKPLRTDHTFHRVRFGLTIPDRAELAAALETLRTLLQRGPEMSASYN